MIEVNGVIADRPDRQATEILVREGGRLVGVGVAVREDGFWSLRADDGELLAGRRYAYLAVLLDAIGEAT